MPPKKAKQDKKAIKRESGGPYICPICNKGFTRRATVKEPHFASCVAKHGNPNHVAWDAHQSCWAKRPGRKVGLLGVAAPSVEWRPLEKDEKGNGVGVDADYWLDQKHDPNELVMGSHDEEGRVMAWNPVNGPQTPTLNQYLPYYSSSPQHTSNPPLLPTIVMNQLVNIPIMACRAHAGKGSLQAMMVWELWNDMLPDDILSYARAPSDRSTLRSRQQAVVWMAQDVYAGLLRQALALADQLKMVAVWRDITSEMNDAAGVARIHDLLVTAIGQNGPFMLDSFAV